MHQSLASKTHQKKRNWTRRSKFRANAVFVVRQAFVSASGSPSLQALLVAFAMMIVFTIRPDIDLEVSRQFWAGGFTLGEDEFLIAVRDLNRMLPAVLLSGLAGMLFAMPFSRGLPRLFPPHSSAHPRHPSGSPRAEAHALRCGLQPAQRDRNGLHRVCRRQSQAPAATRSTASQSSPTTP